MRGGLLREQEVAARQPPIGGRRIESGRGRLEGIGRLHTHARAGAIPGSSFWCSPPLPRGSSCAAMAEVVDFIGGGAGAGGDGGDGGKEWRGKMDLRGDDGGDDGGKAEGVEDAEDFETALRCRLPNIFRGRSKHVCMFWKRG